MTSYDYAQSHYWDTSEDKAQGMSNWMMKGNTLHEAFEDAATCENIEFDLYMLKS